MSILTIFTISVRFSVSINRMKRMNKRLVYGIFISLWAMLGALSCTKADLPDYAPIGDGESGVSLGITFRPLTGATLGGTRSVNGDAIGNIDDVFIAWYRADDRTLAGCRYFTRDELVVTDMQRPTQPDGTTVIPADGETSTQHAEFKDKISIPYGRYRIYAVANMGDMTGDDRIDNEKDFKAVSLEWNPKDIAKNCQMSGYFKVEGANSADSVAVIDRPNLTLHSWIRRAVSKVTVAFDATKLNENIYVYIKSAKIKDIPLHCPLVDTNCPSSDDELIENGDSIVYSNDADYEKWVRLACGRGANKYGSHANDAPSLFFFENMQGKHDNKHEYKNFESKDDMPYGTYVEVRGYYVNNSATNPSYGNIIYRCMLGKNMTDDFNAERNAHYRLTLVFNKDANDVDWHIDYDYVPKPPEIVVPNPMYISYLSNRYLDIPVTVYFDPKLVKVKSLTATIIKNDWGYEDHKYYNKEYDKNLYNGFLSLEGRTETSIDRTKIFTKTKTFNAPTGLGEADTLCRFTVPVYTRPITLGSGYSGNNYYVGRRRNAQVLLTANVESLTETDPATQKPKIITITDTVDVIQIRRLVNPKGIWRANGSDKAFRVTLKYSNSSPTVASKFEDIVSEGPWSASIINGADWIRIKDAEAGDSEYGTKTVTGGTGSKVDFFYKPVDGNPNGKPRFGLIEVRIHNNTCPHVILVSQGVGPVNIGGKNWHMTNVKYCGVDEENPLLEGSMFKYGTSGTAFLSSNNLNEGYGFHQDAYDKVFDVYNSSGTKTKAVFSEVAADETNGFNSTAMKAEDKYNPGVESHVARYEDWQGITDLTKYTRYYGILYGDECTETLDSNTETNTYTNVGDVKGMRGCFVCDNNTGVHLFFPIGNTGHGRRHCIDDEGLSAGATALKGVLKYANRAEEMPSDTAVKLPCLFDLWQETGAIYWYEKKHESAKHYGFDINYYTFGFESYQTKRAWGKDQNGNPTKGVRANSDICFIRRVYDN